MAIGPEIMFPDPLKRDFVPCCKIVVQCDAIGAGHLV